MPTCTHPEAYADDTDELVCVKCGDVVVDDDDPDWWDEDGDVDEWMAKRHRTAYNSAGQLVDRYFCQESKDIWSKLDRAPWFMAAPITFAVILGGAFLLLWLISAS